MKLVLCFAALLVTQSLGFRVPFKTERDWSKIREKWANPDVSLPIRRTGDVAKKSMDIDGRIVNGAEATPHEFPWLVALFMTESGGKYFCTATLIHPEWVLTAAHCAENVLSFEILLGAHNVRLTTEDGRVTVVTNGSSATVHPEWDENTLENDIALIQLPRPVTLNKNISTIALAAKDIGLLVGETVYLAGWGKISDAPFGNISPTLQKATSTVISNTECNNYYDIIQPGIICIVGGNGTSHAGSCNGDSGGPLMLPQKDGTSVQVGVTSFGSSDGCQSGAPDGYTRLSTYIDWINATTGGVVKFV